MVEHFGDVLDFIQDGRGFRLVEEPLWVGAKPCHDIRVLEQVVAGPGEQLSKQECLARPARPSQDERGEAAGGREHLPLQRARDVPHI
jgi:hypothetical protein